MTSEHVIPDGMIRTHSDGPEENGEVEDAYGIRFAADDHGVPRCRLREDEGTLHSQVRGQDRT